MIPLNWRSRAHQLVDTLPAKWDLAGVEPSFLYDQHNQPFKYVGPTWYFVVHRQVAGEDELTPIYTEYCLQFDSMEDPDMRVWLFERVDYNLKKFRGVKLHD